MNLYAAGRTLVLQPSEFLLTINVILGLLLRQLYSFAPSAPWYGVMIYSLLFVSGWIIVDAIISSAAKSSPQTVLAAFFWLLFFFAETVLTPQFTVAAVYASTAGIFVLGISLYQEFCGVTPSWKKRLLGGAMIILGGCLRYEAAFLSLIALLPLFLSLSPSRFALSSKQSLRQFYKACAVLGLPFFMVLGSNRFNEQYYRESPGWQDFRPSIQQLRKFTVRPIAPEEGVLAAAGWSENDLKMAQSYFYVDPVRYSTDTMRQISEKSKFNNNLDPIQQIAFQFGQLFLSPGFKLTFAAALLVILTFGWTNRRDFAIAATGLGWSFALLLAIALQDTCPPNRIWYPLLGITCAALVVLNGLRGERSPRQWSNRLQAGLLIPCLLLAAVELTSINSLSARNIRWQNELKTDLAALKPEARELYVVWGSAFPFEAAVLPFATHDPFPQFKSLAVGIAAHEPHFLNRLQEYQINDIYRALSSDPRVNLVVSSTDKIIMLQKYLAEHYDVKVSPSIRFAGRTFSVYRLAQVD